MIQSPQPPQERSEVLTQEEFLKLRNDIARGHCGVSLCEGCCTKIDKLSESHAAALAEIERLRGLSLPFHREDEVPANNSDIVCEDSDGEIMTFFAKDPDLDGWGTPWIYKGDMIKLLNGATKGGKE